MRIPFRFRIPIVARITLGLVGLTVSVLMLVSLIGLFPDTRSEARQHRKVFCESAAASFSLMAQRVDADTMRTYLETLAQRNSDVQSLGVRHVDGDLVVETGDHATHWQDYESETQKESHVWVRLYAGKEPWGTFEAAFTPREEAGSFGFLRNPQVIHGLMAAVCCLVSFYVYLRIVLRHLDPSRAIPRRVREALDTLAEGLVILDSKERVVLANQAFESTTGTAPDQVLGHSINRIPFISKDESQSDRTPWQEAIQEGKTVTGRLLGVKTRGFEDRTFSVSASPILDDNGTQRGVLASFEDVTNLEQKKRELTSVVQYLRASSDAIKQQNRELEQLASSDPLTGCLNRRSFFEQFNRQWKSAKRHEQPLSVLMIDIDFFKSINDGFGHQMGDDVLRQVGKSLHQQARETDLVCRFGGEEFTILLSMTNSDEAMVAAERIRAHLENLTFPGFSISASLGVSTRSSETETPEDLLELADKSLYVAKRQGRNRVIRWEDIPDDVVTDESTTDRTVGDFGEPVLIPYQAVTALMSGLAYRDHGTAAHSRRVADLCVATAEGLLSLTDCYTLEIAALLHDIGKIGVPDNILLKPGKLTPEEWEVMQYHDIMGVEIIRTSFASPMLTTIVEHHRAHYGNADAYPNLPVGNRIPLASRILAIADAYDSMTSDQVFRKGFTMQEAFEELRRCAGEQFDPELVERFITTVHNRISMQPETEAAISKETALSIGLQIEQLSRVLDEQDYNALDALSSRLQTMATKFGALSIGDKAAELGTILDLDRDPNTIIQVANELLDLCRSTQQQLFESPEPNRDSMAEPVDFASESPSDPDANYAGESG